ncbi:signal peptidase I [Streptomyces poonensis]|uniref:Signal peptidase I n=1 Tax=Streptomyces poonensis TaxID=68255 RepID=A0A918PPW7_9ACTN|nr:signal peptidase I [Streptomyces poonensis]GGZ17232.1 hypothetical protein GCM10010365_41620 [Streptomyces poonensis]GLJ92440.1 hypothetical protein GCM10017589_50490 [Streptomyces poonensis]
MSGGRKLAVAAWVLGPLGLLLAIGGFWGARAGYQATTVSSDSMSPTYTAGDVVVFEEGGGDEVGRGDVVLFEAPERYGPGVYTMQRVIGVGGDHVVCCTGEGAGERLTVNDRPLDEPYVADGVADGVRPYDVTVPEGRLFLLGDHRVNSRDSRFFEEDHDGTVPLSAVRGRVTDDWSVPVALFVSALFGVVVALTGLGLGIAAAVLRRRRRAPVPPWPVQA